MDWFTNFEMKCSIFLVRLSALICSEITLSSLKKSWLLLEWICLKYPGRHSFFLKLLHLKELSSFSSAVTSITYHGLGCLRGFKWYNLVCLKNWKNLILDPLSSCQVFFFFLIFSFNSLFKQSVDRNTIHTYLFSWKVVLGFCGLKLCC